MNEGPARVARQTPASAECEWIPPPPDAFQKSSSTIIALLWWSERVTWALHPGEVLRNLPSQEVRKRQFRVPLITRLALPGGRDADWCRIEWPALEIGPCRER